MLQQLDALPDTIPLTAAEKVRLAELESLVERHLESFLAVGKALSEIRSRRLYRVEFATFEAYLRERWGLQCWKANEVIASYKCAELLLSTTGGPQTATPLPAHIPEGPMREIARVEGDELKAQTWRLVSTLSRQSGTSLRSAAHQISHLVREALEEAEPGNGAPGPRIRVAPKKVFVRSILQLSRESFDVELATWQVKSAKEASTICQACESITERCAQVQAHLLTRYPQLRCHPEQPNESTASDDWGAQS